MPAEVELLFCCARTQLKPETVDRIITLIDSPLEWERLITLAKSHRVLPLLFHHLNDLAPNKIPDKFKNDFQAFSSHHTFNNLNQLSELLKVIDLLKQHHILAIPFKGPALALNIYGKIALRQFDDLDILVAPANFLQARQILIDQRGYQACEDDYFLSNERKLAHIGARSECSLVNLTQKTVIDLHQRLIGGTFFSYPIEFEELSQDLIAVSQVPQMQTLDAETLLLYLCAHGAKSLWQRLIWICDVAELVAASPNLDWDSVLLKAQTTKLDRMLLLGLQLAHEILDTPLPDKVTKKLDNDLEVHRLTQHVYQYLVSAKGGLVRDFTFEKLIFQYRSISDPQEKVGYCLRCLVRHGFAPCLRLVRPSHKDRLFFGLPRYLYFLYYVVRPIRVLTACIFRPGDHTENA